MTLAKSWATDDLPPRGYPQYDKIAAVWGTLTAVGREQFRAELEAATESDAERVVEAWHATMRIITDPGYPETQELVEALRGTKPLLTPADVRSSIGD